MVIVTITMITIIVDIIVNFILFAAYFKLRQTRIVLL